MKAKKIFEFQQGQNPYDIMGLGKFTPGDKIIAKYNLRWSGSAGIWILDNEYEENIKAGDKFIVKQLDVSYSALFPIAYNKPKNSENGISIEKPSADGEVRWFPDNDELIKYFKRTI
jgi:hypothetical protein